MQCSTGERQTSALCPLLLFLFIFDFFFFFFFLFLKKKIRMKRNFFFFHSTVCFVKFVFRFGVCLTNVRTFQYLALYII